MDENLRCAAYCTASAYDMEGLKSLFQIKGGYTLFREVLYRKDGDSCAFFFPFGAVVFWNSCEENELACLSAIKPYEVLPEKEIEDDEFLFHYGKYSTIHQDQIIVGDQDPKTKLAFSHGLSQSVKLSIFENGIQETIARTKSLPEQLASLGKITLTRRQISKKMGELFMARNSINLHTDILDTPEFFWDHEDLEVFYEKTCHYLDLTARVDVLNKRLDIVKELFEILNDHLEARHSSRLEWVIIILIAVEVAMALATDIFHLL